MEIKTHYNMNYYKISSQVLSETAKAYKLSIEYWTRYDQPNKTAEIWVPKSCVSVEDNKVVEVASFILDKWAKERIKWLQSKYGWTMKDLQISFDLAQKEMLIQYNKDKQDKYIKEQEELGNKILTYIKPISNKFIRELEYWCRWFGEQKKRHEFIEFANKIAKKFGTYMDSLGEKEKKNLVKWREEKGDTIDLEITLKQLYNIWFLGEDHVGYNWRGIDEQKWGFTKNEWDSYFRNKFNFNSIKRKLKMNYNLHEEFKSLYVNYINEKNN